ncbi:YybS family protein [Peribacillus alkalitolerans]|uniref:YybS family protein n=1 Tax=Peribacillus alkalitolerans TaxID=1550385 RepID=UPI0013D749A2|nr:YybS family protein [Peribacillus alkalitolerans]
MTQGRRIAEGGVLLAIFSLMIFLSIQIPILGIILIFFMPVPFILFAAKNTVSWSVGFVFISALLATLFGTLVAAPTAIMIGLMGITVGSFINRNKQALDTYIAAVLVFLVTVILFYGAAAIFFDFNIVKISMDMTRDAILQSQEIMKNLGQPVNKVILERFDAAMKLAQTLLPSLIVVSSMIMVMLFFYASNPLVKRFSGKRIALLAFREIRLPKSLLWYYLIVMGATYFINPAPEQFSYTVLMNLLFMLQFFMLLQGYSFIFYFCHEKKWAKALPISITFLSLIMPILLFFVRFLGIIDLGFNLREKIQKK